MAQIKGTFFKTDEFQSQKSGKVYTTLFEPATGGMLKLVSPNSLTLQEGKQYAADLKVRFVQGQGGSQFVELQPAGSQFNEVKA